MANILNEFSLSGTDFSSIENAPQLAIVNEHFGMILGVGPYREHFIKVGQPYRFLEGRILMVTDGTATCELNLETHRLKKGDIVLLMPETVMELQECSNDFNLIGVIYKEHLSATKNILLHATPKEWQETLRLVTALWDIAHHEPFRTETVRLLISTIIHNIQDINRIEEEQQQPGIGLTRQEQLFQQFKRLVNEHCASERSIPYYAERLAITPHYLSTLISKVSGHSVMYWINRATVLQAKVMLKDKQMLASEIADRLNFPSPSAFGMFFKRETGMTPGEYQGR